MGVMDYFVATLLAGALGLVLLGLVLLVGDQIIETDQEICLKKLAKEICEERGMQFGFYEEVNDRIGCKEDERKVETVKLKFLPEELEGCKE